MEEQTQKQVTDTTQQQNHGKLMAKMAEVIKVTGNVAKKGTNKDQGYKFATHSDIIEELRKHIAEKGLFILPKPDSYDITEIQSRSGTKGALITMKMDFEIIDTETGYSITVKWFGQGMDYGDKAMYKSYTGALKYFLLDTFMISTGDDPEATEAEPARAPKASYNAQPKAPSAPIQQPPMTEEQKAKIAELLPKKGKTMDDVEDYAKRAYKKSYAEWTTAQANAFIKKLEGMSDAIDNDAADKAIQEQMTEQPKI